MESTENGRRVYSFDKGQGASESAGITEPTGSIDYGRKVYSFDESHAVLESTSITEKALAGEDEAAFTRRLLIKFKGRHGTIEVVFKRGRPDYAIITLA